MAHRRLPSLSALRAFEAAARHESAKQAAEELSVTATAISHQIRSLEESLGVALFLRKPKLELTDQGGAAADVGSRVRQHQRYGRTPERESPAARRSPSAPHRPSRCAGWCPGSACCAIPIRISICASIPPEPVALDGVTADIAIRYGDGRWPGWWRRLFDNTFVPVCSPPRLAGCNRAAQTPVDPLPCASRLVRPIHWASWQSSPTCRAGCECRAGLLRRDHAISAAIGAQGVALMIGS